MARWSHGLKILKWDYLHSLFVFLKQFQCCLLKFLLQSLPYALSIYKMYCVVSSVVNGCDELWGEEYPKFLSID